MSYSAGRVSQAYASVGTHSQVEAASPHRLIQLLMDGALDRLALARGQIQRGEISLKANSISRTMSIIDGLRLSLDHSVDSSLSENLEGLYDYMNRRLLLANVKNDTEALDEVSGLLRELKEAWDAIPDPSRESTAYSAGEAVVQMAVPADIGALRAAELLSPRQQQLRELLLMTEEIGSLAEQGEWNEALSRQRDRRLAMEAFFAQACSAEESGLVAQVIQHILTIDDNVSTALANKRNTLSHKQLEHRRKAQNVGRYLSNCQCPLTTRASAADSGQCRERSSGHSHKWHAQRLRISTNLELLRINSSAGLSHYGDHAGGKSSLCSCSIRHHKQRFRRPSGYIHNNEFQ